MDTKFRKFFKILTTVLLTLLAVLYPVFVYYSLVIRNIPLRQFSLVVIVFAFFIFITGTSRGKSFRINALILLGVGVLCLFLNSTIILKFYPLIMNIVFLVTFGVTLLSPPCMIFRFAVMQDKSIKGSLGEKHIEAYCYKVTIVWCIFFIFNGSIAAWTIFSGSDVLWSIYNGGVSYILTGMVFAGEFIIRMIVQKKIPKSVPLSAIKNNSRSFSAILCYEGTSYSESNYKTWRDFLEGTAILRREIEKINSRQWLLYCEDYWYFLLAFTALLQCKKEILLSADINSDYITELRNSAPLLTDQEKYFNAENNFNIPDLLDKDIKIETSKEKIPPISAEDSLITIFVENSGNIKAEKYSLTEIENKNNYILTRWGEEFIKRKICSTVNQHYICGLMYSILLPFTAAVPFRRNKNEFPLRFEKLNDTEYMIITEPAYLEQAVKIKKHENICLKSPWIFTFCGMITVETARAVNEMFGFWPVEVRESAETSGFVWRQSDKDPEWSPLDTQEIKNENTKPLFRSGK